MVKSDAEFSAESFFAAIEDGDVAAVHRMLAARPELVQSRSEFGFPPLMRACSAMGRDPEMVRLLIEAGAGVNEQTSEGYTALHMLVDVNGPRGTGPMPAEIARLLVAAGAALEVRQHWGWTPLMRAVVEGTADELRALADLGAEVNCRFPHDTLPVCFAGRTTLEAALAWPDKVRLLLQAGADPWAVDDYGQTALEYGRHLLAEATPGDCRMEAADDDPVARVLAQMAADGVDLDRSIDASGKTPRQVVEETLREQAAAAPSFDYRQQLLQSLALVEQAAHERPRMIHGLFETHINVVDLDRSLAFYRDVLGLELGRREDDRRAAFLWMGRRGEAMLGLWEKPAAEVVPQHFALRSTVDDVLQRSVQWLDERGLACRNFLNDGTKRPMVFGWMPAIAIYFDDPDGHTLELIAMLDGEPRPELGIVSWEQWRERTGRPA